MHLSHTVGVIITAITCFILSTWGSKPYESRSAHIVRELDSLARTLDLTQSELMEHRPTTRKVIRESDLFPSQTGDTLKLENSASVIKKKGPWFLGTCTGTKNSGAWMREWIELQIAVGVDHVWVADDNPANSTDITTNVLKHYEKLGYVTIIPPPGLTHPGCEQISGPDGRHNCAPVKHCFEYASPHVKWLLFADTDEFIFPHNGCSVAEHIKNHCNPDATHIYVKWERFGTSHFETHPNGLMLENFLSSGGTCHRRHNGECGMKPFDNCPECRHSKVIYNTECAKVEHAGWIHWPVNTTDWKESKLPEYKKMQWVKSPGTGGNWKKETCQYTGLIADAVKCNKWAKFGGGSKRPKEYTPDCCTAGIGYNHYGTQSRQYYERKQRNVATSKRGWRTGFGGIDNKGVISFSVLKFMRAMRRRFKALGTQVSDNVAFVDVGEGKSCFVEQNFVYAAVESTEMRYGAAANNSDECCLACHNTSMCKAFTFTKLKRCNLLIGSTKVPGTEIRDNEYHLPANRTWSLKHASGIPMREGECVFPGHVPSPSK
eukprot:TRINITY_DN137_c0_g1_i6.p1 TRINITY_DN137_c0_g1~~TRINITY_DN137_c0_g1_i6.p1  ORF type:complete len:547 (+),score=159.37 TRINITY_DN137_c0_g1_i6:66-1706(+)